MEKTLHDTGHYKYWEIPRLHRSEQRRLFEGVHQHGQMQRRASESPEDPDASPEVNEQKRSIKQGQQAGRQAMLDDINQQRAT